MPLRAVLFDIGETLWHAPNPPAPGEFRAMAAARARDRLHAWGIDADPAAVARSAWDALDASVRADPILFVTVTDGEDAFIYDDML